MNVQNMSQQETEDFASQTIGACDRWTTTDEHGYTIREHPMGELDPKRIIVVGAGATGICFSKFAETQMSNVEVQIYDKNHDIGGTWLENRYPGCACDIPAVTYQFSWSPNSNWSEFYASSEEIWEYLNDIVEKNGLRKYMKLQHTVLGAEWSSEDAKWTVKIQRPDKTVFEDTCDFFINGSGLLNKWKWPDIKGLKSFRGQICHSADWDPDMKLDGKRVAVVGSGSSSIQIVASIQPRVEKLYTWVRSQIWVTPGFAQAFAGPNGCNMAYSEEMKAMFRNSPNDYLRYQKQVEASLAKRFENIFVGTPQQQAAMKYARAEMERRLDHRKELVDKIIPTEFGVGCRRPTPGSGYLEGLVARNTTVYTDQLREITEKGFLDADGVEHEVDAIICGTGFDTSHIPRFPVVAHGQDLRDIWRKDAVAYFCMAVPHFPNYYTTFGPYHPPNGSVLLSLEYICRYIIDIIRKSQFEHIRAISPRQDRVQNFRDHCNLFNKRTVFAQRCRSQFKGGDIHGIPRTFPGSRSHYLETILKPRYEDYEMEYEDANPFAYMGNGYSTRDYDERDSTWYLGLLDGQDIEISDSTGVV